MYTAFPTPAPPDTPLLTARLMLRPYQPPDGAAFFGLIDADRTRLRPSFPAREATAATPAAATRLLHQFRHDWTTGRLYVLGIWHRQTGEYLGDISLKPNWTPPITLEIGYYLATAAEGQGYAREALAAVTGFGFDTLHAKRLLIRCRPDNPRSLAVAVALGFQPLPVRPRPAWLRRMLGGSPPVLYYILKR
ncbi:GNAT family N-acetyltransferase [Hymenobacter rubripertinctus]|uniref:N-acetyltransferase n=1 Tax=Hymenobacter rubripertinctus TaxID=2029981 RepID=A0A418R907_9BACT|nr:GNAT family N-acetyltransferase [Hymenobacter rubripertinctus]RIY14120.1 N-acetyltransferase [Hymenobacter rubripertinctus]